ncbi:MAG: transcriptional regulator, partial [Marmoricola sp.]
MVHVRSDATVASALEASRRGMGDADNASLHGVSVKTIRRWRRDYERRGQARGQGHTRAQCPRCDGVPIDEEAFAELFGWYLGDGHISAQRRGVFGLHIANDAQYTALTEHILELMLRVKPGGRPHLRHRPGCVVCTVSWKHWPCLFPQHGPGRKHERALGMAPWQWRIVEEHPADFLRGLFHSDGARVRNWAT